MMNKNEIKRVSLLLFLIVCIFDLHNPTYAQRETVIDHKGTKININNIVTTAETAPPDPFIEDIWFDTTTYLTKVWNGTSWNEIVRLPDIGDIKFGVQATDHDGWIKLDGRAVNTLTTAQQIEIATLGFSGNIPNVEDRTLMNRSAGNIADVGGSTSIQIQQHNLPNITFSGTTSMAGNHNHTIQDRHSTTTGRRGAGGRAPLRDRLSTTRTTSSNGIHTHTATVSTGGSGTVIDVTHIIPKFLHTNVFVYLGR